VLIDATVVRGILVPAALALLGERAWRGRRALPAERSSEAERSPEAERSLGA
jgi:RND superfamily putative drug exporter